MKKIALFIFALIGANNARAARLYCANPVNEKNNYYFSADLYNNTLHSFFDIDYAILALGFSVANNMRCAGSSLDHISCIGYWYDLPEYIVEVQIKKENNIPTATIKNLRTPANVALSLKNGIGENLKMNCEVQ